MFGGLLRGMLLDNLTVRSILNDTSNSIAPNQLATTKRSCKRRKTTCISEDVLSKHFFFLKKI